MAIQLLQNLIAEPDAFELIRDQIAALLVAERDNQLLLAAGEPNPQLWNFLVFTERSTTWETTLNDGTNRDPIVNVWFDSDSSNEKSTTRAETQKFNATYNIDIYGFGVSRSTAAGHDTGDEIAAKETHRASRLVRNILMSPVNSYLQLPRGFAWDRKIESRQSYQPRLDQQASVEVVAMRMRFNVSFNETSQEYTGVPLSNVVLSISRADTGEVIFGDGCSP